MWKISSILLVEDNSTDALLLQHALKRAGYKGRFDVVGSADDAYKLLLERLDSEIGLPGLILLDIGLPQESGIEVLGKLKSNRVLSSIPTVVFSGSESTQDMARARELGTDWYFVKQPDPRDLDQIVKQLMRISTPQGNPDRE